MYNVKYTIHGIYGDVTFTKTLNKTEEEIFLMFDELKKSICENDLFSFDIVIKDCKTFERKGYTEEPILGLPNGINEEMYFKMALLEKLNIK